MKTVLLPVKDFRNAKQRLASALDATARANLARAMLTDVLDAVAQSTIPERVVVFTASTEVAQMAGEFGFEAIIETRCEWPQCGRQSHGGTVVYECDANFFHCR